MVAFIVSASSKLSSLIWMTVESSHRVLTDLSGFLGFVVNILSSANLFIVNRTKSVLEWNDFVNMPLSVVNGQWNGLALFYDIRIVKSSTLPCVNPCAPIYLSVKSFRFFLHFVFLEALPDSSQFNFVLFSIAQSFTLKCHQFF